MLKFCAVFTKSQLRRESLLLPKRMASAKNDDCQKKAAIILSGSGHLDGSCIYETTAVVFHLSRLKVQPVFYAPACQQYDVVDHRKGCPVSESRCAITEAARLARGKITPLNELQHCDADCIVVPGGFGAAKTLSTFEMERGCCTLNEDLVRVLEEFHELRKPMAFLCIAAVLPARLFSCVKITLGKKGNPQKWPYQYAIDCASMMGAEVEPRTVDGLSFDKQHMVFTTPAFMYDATMNEINTAVGSLIEYMVKYV